MFSDCKINVHKRCKKNVANSCGINPKEFAKVIRDIGLTPDTRKKVREVKEWENHWNYRMVIQSTVGLASLSSNIFSYFNEHLISWIDSRSKFIKIGIQ